MVQPLNSVDVGFQARKGGGFSMGKSDTFYWKMYESLKEMLPLYEERVEIYAFV